MPCHILRVFACKMNCGAVEEMKKTKIYNDNKLKLKDISGDHRFIQARRLFNIKVSNPHRHLTLFAIYFTCMALHHSRVNFMQVAFLNWHQAGICCSKSMSTPNAAANQSLWDSK